MHKEKQQLRARIYRQFAGHAMAFNEEKLLYNISK